MRSLLSPLLTILLFVCAQIGANAVSSSSSSTVAAITPIPMELLNPRLTEFRRIDNNGDDQISFSEFLLSDRPWMESQSRRYHQMDANSDGRVTRREFEQLFRERDGEQDRQNSFFKQLTVTSTIGPIVEREQFGNATNGSSRMRFFSAGSRKFSAIAQGTGLYPPSSASSSSSGEVSPPVLLNDHDRHFSRFFPYHQQQHQFLLPSSAAILGARQSQSPSAGGQTQNDPLGIGSLSQQSVAHQRALKNEVAGQII